VVTLDEFLSIARERGVLLKKTRIGGYLVLVREDRKSRPIPVPGYVQPGDVLGESFLRSLCHLLGLDPVDFHLDPLD